MTRIDNTNREIQRASLDYIEREIRQALHDMKDADDEVTKLQNDGSFTAANITKFKNNKINSAKAHNQNAVSMYRWLLDEFNISIPAAFTDAEVDGKNLDIRTHEE